MKIFSSQFKDGGMIPRKYTCDGEDVNPPLEIKNVPYEAKSLVLIVHDPDAPVENGWTHWVLFNIPPRTMSITEDNSPHEAVEGLTSFERIGYGGPCPPGGIHHYEFHLYALDVELELEPGAKKFQIEKAMVTHIISHTMLTGLYRRQT